MVDVIFRDVEPETLRWLIGVMPRTAYELCYPTDHRWTVQLAELVLRRATRSAARLARAVVDGGGTVTADVARAATFPVATQHASGSLFAAFRRIARYPGSFDLSAAVPRRRPIYALTVRPPGSNVEKLSGYRMDPDALDAFAQALQRFTDLGAAGVAGGEEDSTVSRNPT